MNYPKHKIDRVSVCNATAFTNLRIDLTLERAKQYTEDPDKKKRLELSICKPCFYERTVAGQAFTNRPCGLCETVLQSSNTNVDVLCIGCAKVNNLCKKCGGDIDGKDRRKRKCYDT